MIRHTRLSNDTATTEIYTLSLHDALGGRRIIRSEEHTSELQSHDNLVCRLLLEKKMAEVMAELLDRFEHSKSAVGVTIARFAHRTPGVGVTIPGVVRNNGVVASAFFFLKERAPTEIYPLPLHDLLPI